MANYIRIRASRAIGRVRGMVRREAYGSETVSEDPHAIGSVAAQLSDAEILQYVNAAVRDIAYKCKAWHVYPLVASGASTGATPPSMIRLLHSRVTRNAIRARRRDTSAYRRLAAAGMGGSEESPIYTFSGGRIDVYPSSGTVLYYYVQRPSEISTSSVRAGTDTMEVDERFEAAIAYYASSKIWYKMENNSMGSFFTQLYEAEIAPYREESLVRSAVDTEVEVE